MSPFFIWVVILTLAYVLYYATIIAMDLNSTQKKSGDSSETIPLDDANQRKQSEPVVKDIVAKTVVEDPENGSFNIIDPSLIAEITEEQTEEREDEQRQEPEEPSSVPQDLPAEPLAESDEPSEQPDDTPNDNTEGEPEEELEEPDEEDIQQSNITTVAFVNDLKLDKKPEEPFDESKAFEPAPEPTFGISKIYGPEANPVAEQKVNTVNQSLLAVETKGDEVISFNLAQTIRAHNKYAAQNEITHF